MDPNTALANMREAIRRLDDPSNTSTIGEYAEAARDLRDEAGALDEWLSRGGFLPTDWTRAGENNRLIRPFDILLCETCDTDREVLSVACGGVIRFRVCGHVQP